MNPSEDSARLARVEDLVAGLVTDMAVIKAGQVSAAQAIVDRAASRSARRNWLLAVLAAALTVPGSILAAKDLDPGLFPAGHTVVVKVSPPASPRGRIRR